MRNDVNRSAFNSKVVIIRWSSTVTWLMILFVNSYIPQNQSRTSNPTSMKHYMRGKHYSFTYLQGHYKY